MNLTFSLSNGSGFGKKSNIFAVDMSSYVHIDNKNRNILIFGKESIQELHSTILTAEK